MASLGGEASDVLQGGGMKWRRTKFGKLLEEAVSNPRQCEFSVEFGQAHHLGTIPKNN